MNKEIKILKIKTIINDLEWIKWHSKNLTQRQYITLEEIHDTLIDIIKE